MLNFDEIAKIITEKWELIAAVMVIVSATGIAGVAGLWTVQQNRRKAQRLRQIPRGDFPFEVIKPGSSGLLKQIMGGDEQNPLADCNIPYQERQRDRNVRQELDAAFLEKNWVLVLGKSGLGKTREAAHLADVLNKEGWTVLKLKVQPGEWLDVPKVFPSEISPDDKLLFFLDDLNRWMYAGNPHEIHPEAGEELARPLREPVQERLPRLLRYFEQQGKSSYVRVIATARNERASDKPGDLSPWQKLQWEKYESFWQQFQCYSLVKPSEEAIVRLLTDCVAIAGLRGNPAEYGQIARRNDGTFRNITENLIKAQNRGLAVNNQEFSPNLDETWREDYNNAIRRYPLAKHVYDAVELLRTLNLWLTPPMLVATTQLLLPGRGLRRWWQIWQLRSVLRDLVTTEQILTPKDGQIEAKKTDPVDVGRYVPAILRQLRHLTQQDPTYPIAAECFACGNALYHLNRYEEAITSYDQVLKHKPDKHEAWYNRGSALVKLNRYKEAIPSYDQAVKIKPNYHEAWYNRGWALATLGCYEEAISSYEKAVKINPDDHEAWNNCGNAQLVLGHNQEALKSYDQAVSIKPGKHEVWNNRGIALVNLNRFEEAISSYDQALAIKPEDPGTFYNKACCYALQGNVELAIDNLQRAIHITPDKYCERATTDTDFDPIRDDARFQTCLNLASPG